MSRATDSAGAVAATTPAASSVTRPEGQDGPAADAVDEGAGDERRQVHRRDVHRDHEAGGSEAVAVIAHVDRRHRHDRDHHDLGEDHRHGGEPEGVGVAGPWRLRRRRRGRAASAAIARAVSSGSGRRRTATAIAREAVGDGREHERAGELEDPELHREVAGGLDEVRAENGPQRRRDEHDADARSHAAPSSRGRRPRSAPAGSSRFRSRTGTGRRQERHAVDRRGSDHPEAADRSHRVAGGQPDPAAAIGARAGRPAATRSRRRA